MKRAQQIALLAIIGLIWRKIKGEWKIVVDHTSQKLPVDSL